MLLLEHITRGKIGNQGKAEIPPEAFKGSSSAFRLQREKCPEHATRIWDEEVTALTKKQLPVSAWRGFHTLIAALALVTNRHRSGGGLASLMKAASGEDLTQGFVLHFLFPSPCTAEVITP